MQATNVTQYFKANWRQKSTPVAVIHGVPYKTRYIAELPSYHTHKNRSNQGKQASRGYITLLTVSVIYYQRLHLQNPHTIKFSNANTSSSAIQNKPHCYVVIKLKRSTLFLCAAFMWVHCVLCIQGLFASKGKRLEVWVFITLLFWFFHHRILCLRL